MDLRAGSKRDNGTYCAVFPEASFADSIRSLTGVITIWRADSYLPYPCRQTGLKHMVTQGVSDVP